MALTIEEAQSLVLTNDPTARTADVQRRARDLVSKAQLIEWQNQNAANEAKRAEDLAAERDWQRDQMLEEVSRSNRVAWGLEPQGQSFPGSAVYKPNASAEAADAAQRQKDRQRDIQLVRAAIRRADNR
jgi:hypothetical protein